MEETETQTHARVSEQEGIDAINDPSSQKDVGHSLDQGATELEQQHANNQEETEHNKNGQNRLAHQSPPEKHVETEGDDLRDLSRIRDEDKKFDEKLLESHDISHMHDSSSFIRKSDLSPETIGKLKRKTILQKKHIEELEYRIKESEDREKKRILAAEESNLSYKYDSLKRELEKSRGQNINYQRQLSEMIQKYKNVVGFRGVDKTAKMESLLRQREKEIDSIVYEKRYLERVKKEQDKAIDALQSDRAYFAKAAKDLAHELNTVKRGRIGSFKDDIASLQEKLREYEKRVLSDEKLIREQSVIIATLDMRQKSLCERLGVTFNPLLDQAKREGILKNRAYYQKHYLQSSKSATKLPHEEDTWGVIIDSSDEEDVSDLPLADRLDQLSVKHQNMKKFHKISERKLKSEIELLVSKLNQAEIQLREKRKENSLLGERISEIRTRKQYLAPITKSSDLGVPSPNGQHNLQTISRSSDFNGDQFLQQDRKQKENVRYGQPLLSSRRQESRTADEEEPSNQQEQTELEQEQHEQQVEQEEEEEEQEEKEQNEEKDSELNEEQDEKQDEEQSEEQNEEKDDEQDEDQEQQEEESEEREQENESNEGHKEDFDEDNVNSNEDEKSNMQDENSRKDVLPEDDNQMKSHSIRNLESRKQSYTELENQRTIGAIKAGDAMFDDTDQIEDARVKKIRQLAIWNDNKSILGIHATYELDNNELLSGKRHVNENLKEKYSKEPWMLEFDEQIVEVEGQYSDEIGIERLCFSTNKGMKKDFGNNSSSGVTFKVILDNEGPICIYGCKRPRRRNNKSEKVTIAGLGFKTETNEKKRWASKILSQTSV